MSIHQMVRDILARQVLFGGLPEEEIDHLAAASTTVLCPKGRTIFCVGDEGTGLYVVLSGRVRISLSDAEGRECVLAVVDSGQFFGELSLLDGRARSADATAIEDCRFLFIPRSVFLDRLSEPHLASRILAELCSRLRATNSHVHTLSCLELPARLARLLLSFAESYGMPSRSGGVRIGIRVSQKDMGEMVGGSRERVNRSLQAWSRQGILDRQDGHLVVRDLEALRGLAQVDLVGVG
jgi:CRP-like cAMP-binding protein